MPAVGAPIEPVPVTHVSEIVFLYRAAINLAGAVNQDGKGSRGIWIMPLMIVAGKRYVEG